MTNTQEKNLTSAVRDYLGDGVDFGYTMKVERDPKIAGTYSIRLTDSWGESLDLLLTGGLTDGEGAIKDRIEEVEFENWPPVSRGTKKVEV